MKARCPKPEDTEALGARLAASLRPGDVIVLAGDLGTGKTLLAKGIATGLAVDETVTSPSFMLAREYRSGFIPMVHVDVYRLGSLHEFEDLDVVEQALDGILVIEWGEAVETVLPEDHLRIEFAVEEDETRVLRFVGKGAWADRELRGVS